MSAKGFVPFVFAVLMATASISPVAHAGLFTKCADFLLGPIDPSQFKAATLSPKLAHTVFEPHAKGASFQIAELSPVGTVFEIYEADRTSILKQAGATNRRLYLYEELVDLGLRYNRPVETIARALGLMPPAMEIAVLERPTASGLRSLVSRLRYASIKTSVELIFWGATQRYPAMKRAEKLEIKAAYYQDDSPLTVRVEATPNQLFRLLLDTPEVRDTAVLLR